MPGDGRSAEKSFTHRHLCEFTGLDLEMAIDEHYNEVLDVLDRLFVYMFSGLRSKFGGRLLHIALIYCAPPCHVLHLECAFLRVGHRAQAAGRRRARA